jgi:uncharacterized membrane protein
VNLIPVISSPKRTIFAWCRSSLILSSAATQNFLDTTRTQHCFRCCWVCFYDLLFETDKARIGADLLPCLVPESQIPYILGIKPRTIFRVSVLCFCNVFLETNNFGLGPILLSCLVSEVEKRLSPGTKLWTLEFQSSNILFLITRKKYANFGSNWCIRSRVISEQTHKPTMSIMYA